MTKQKNIIRTNIKKQLALLTPKEKQKQETVISQKLLALPIWKQTKVICLYYPMKTEVNILSFLMKQKGKQFCLPRYNRQRKEYEIALVNKLDVEVIKGKYDIYEPKSDCPTINKAKIGLWIVPAIAFDSKGNRIGNGYGYYDKLLQNSTGFHLGLGFDFQLLDRVPSESHDQKVDYILTI